LLSWTASADILLNHREQSFAGTGLFPQRADEPLLVGIVVAYTCKVLALVLHHESSAILQLRDKVGIEGASSQRQSKRIGVLRELDLVVQAPDDVPVAEAGQPPMTRRPSHRDDQGVIERLAGRLQRGARARLGIDQLLGNARAISRGSCIVRPCAIRPCTSSLVARYTLSGSFSMCS
jgi:hypothetical protein